MTSSGTTTRATGPAPGPAPADDLDLQAGRLDAAMRRIDDLEPAARAAVTEALEALNTLHRNGLTTVVRTLRDDDRGRELLYALVDDPGVRMLLSMHGLIRPDPVTLARQVLERVRPQLRSHGGDVELSHLDDSIAYVRLQGACNGCSMAAVTMRDGVEEALIAGVPGLRGVEVLPNEPEPTLIPISGLTVRRSADSSAAGPSAAGPSAADSASVRAEIDALLASGWCRAVPVDAVPTGELLALTLQPADSASLPAIVVNLDGRLTAYVNECAHQGRPLDGALIDAGEGTLTCPWHGLCYDATSGECLTLPGAQLIQLPLRLLDGVVYLRPDGV